MERKTYTFAELHNLDPAKVINHDGHLMTVLEVIRHLIDGRWPDQTSETASHQEPQARTGSSSKRSCGHPRTPWSRGGQTAK